MCRKRVSLSWPSPLRAAPEGKLLWKGNKLKADDRDTAVNVYEAVVSFLFFFLSYTVKDQLNVQQFAYFSTPEIIFKWQVVDVTCVRRPWKKIEKKKEIKWKRETYNQRLFCSFAYFLLIVSSLFNCDHYCYYFYLFIYKFILRMYCT